MLGSELWPTSLRFLECLVYSRFQFTGHGLTVLEWNYLEVYIYEKWSDKEILD